MQVMGFLSAKSPSVSKKYHYYRRHHLQQPHFRKDNLIWSQTTETVIADDPVSDRKNLNWKMLASEVWWTFATDVKTLTAQLAELHHTTS